MASLQCQVTFFLLQSIYEPGKRHWLKVKKDYLADGAMADTADLVVLGAYYGTGNKGTHNKPINIKGKIPKKKSLAITDYYYTFKTFQEVFL